MTLALRVRHVLTATPRSRILKLDLGTARFEFRAGQAAWLAVPGTSPGKPYSIACAPEESDRSRRLEFLVQVDAAGSAGPHLPALRRGLVVGVRGPVGRFVFPENPSERHFLFIAGGTGIAPLRSMVQHLLLRNALARIGLLYSARTADELAYATELRRLARERRIDLTLTVTREAGPRWRGGRGRIALDQLARLVHTPETLCFLCGPPALVSDVPVLLQRLGIAPSRIRMEEW